jgi:hypothetical protein
MEIIKNNKENDLGYYTSSGLRITFFTFKILEIQCLEDKGPSFKVEAFNGRQKTVFILKNVLKLKGNSFGLAFINEGNFTCEMRFNTAKMHSIIHFELNAFVEISPKPWYAS